MCLSKPKISVPKVAPPPPPAAPEAKPSLKTALDNATAGGPSVVDPATGRRKRGLASLRIDKSASPAGLQIDK